MPALGARAFEVHNCNYWPEWGIKLVQAKRAAENYAEIARMLVEEAMPFYKLWVEIEKSYTSGDGYLDKLCMELVGLPSSRCRPPTRDIRERYRDKTRDMLIKIGAPRVISDDGMKLATYKKAQGSLSRATVHRFAECAAILARQQGSKGERMMKALRKLLVAGAFALAAGTADFGARRGRRAAAPELDVLRLACRLSPRQGQGLSTRRPASISTSAPATARARRTASSPTATALSPTAPARSMINLAAEGAPLISVGVIDAMGTEAIIVRPDAGVKDDHRPEGQDVAHHRQCRREHLLPAGA